MSSLPRLTQAQWHALLANPVEGTFFNRFFSWKITERLERLGFVVNRKTSIQGASLVASLRTRMENGYLPSIMIRRAMLDCYDMYADLLAHDPDPMIRAKAVSHLRSDQMSSQLVCDIAHDSDVRVRRAGARLLHYYPAQYAEWNGETDPDTVRILAEHGAWRRANPLTGRTSTPVVRAWAMVAFCLSDNEFDRLLRLHKADRLIVENEYERMSDRQRLLLLEHAVQTDDMETIDLYAKQRLNHDGRLTVREHELVHDRSPYWQAQYAQLMEQVQCLTGGIIPVLKPATGLETLVGATVQ